MNPAKAVIYQTQNRKIGYDSVRKKGKEREWHKSSSNGDKSCSVLPSSNCEIKRAVFMFDILLPAILTHRLYVSILSLKAEHFFSHSSLDLSVLASSLAVLMYLFA